MKVRKATIVDLEIITDYAFKLIQLHQSFNPVRWSKLEDHKNRVREHLEEALSDPQAVIYVLENESQVLGYSFIRFEGEDLVSISEARAWIHDIYVDEMARGKNGGTLLLEAVINAAKEYGSSTVMLGTAEENEYARQVFTKVGFKPVSREMMLVL